jgi:molecular chaperone HscB
MDIKQNFFQLYSLPRCYAVDLSQLQNRHRQLQRKFHPDRYVTATTADQRLAVQVTAYLNQAFKTLKNPVARGVYLLELAGLEPLAVSKTQMPADFLLQQISLRESIDDLPKSLNMDQDISELFNRLQQQYKAIEIEFANTYGNGELSKAEVAIRKLQFMERLEQQLQLQAEVLMELK